MGPYEHIWAHLGSNIDPDWEYMSAQTGALLANNGAATNIERETVRLVNALEGTMSGLVYGLVRSYRSKVLRTSKPMDAICVCDLIVGLTSRQACLPLRGSRCRTQNDAFLLKVVPYGVLVGRNAMAIKAQNALPRRG
jgi:hypothetical protein